MNEGEKRRHFASALRHHITSHALSHVHAVQSWLLRGVAPQGVVSSAHDGMPHFARAEINSSCGYLRKYSLSSSRYRAFSGNYSCVESKYSLMGYIWRGIFLSNAICTQTY